MQRSAVSPCFYCEELGYNGREKGISETAGEANRFPTLAALCSIFVWHQIGGGSAAESRVVRDPMPIPVS